MYDNAHVRIQLLQINIYIHISKGRIPDLNYHIMDCHGRDIHLIQYVSGSYVSLNCIHSSMYVFYSCLPFKFLSFKPRPGLTRHNYTVLC